MNKIINITPISKCWRGYECNIKIELENGKSLVVRDFSEKKKILINKIEDIKINGYEFSIGEFAYM